MKFIAFCPNGLEDVCNEELQQKIQLRNTQKVPKKIYFDSDAEFAEFQNLRTLDDINLFVKEIKINSRFTLEEFQNEIEAIDFSYFQKKIGEFRTLKNTFSITLSTFKFHGFEVEEAKALINPTIAKKYSWEYTPMNHENLDIRINVERLKIVVSIRLMAEPLYHRSYKEKYKMASLKPTIAASLVRMATKGKKDLRVADIFCGSGTILCEALLENHKVYGVDTDSTSIEYTRNNLQNLGFESTGNVRNGNAYNTGFEDKFFDCVISNLPWDEQIKVHSLTELYSNTAKEIGRILKPEGTACLLVKKPELLVKFLHEAFPNATIKQRSVSINGQKPTIISLVNPIIEKAA